MADSRWKRVGYLGLSGLVSGTSAQSFLSAISARSLSYWRAYPLPMAMRRAQERSAQSVAPNKLGVGVVRAWVPPCRVAIINFGELMKSCLGSSTSEKVPL